jgi:peptide/nickel transport system permease protein
MAELGATRQDALLAATARLRRRALRDRRFSNVTLYVGAAIVLVFVIVAVAAPLVAPHNPTEQDLLSAFQGPSVSHPFGTDSLGQDIFSRVLYGLRTDLLLGVVCTYVPLVIGMLLGACAGYFRGPVESVIMGLVDLTIALPFLVLVLAIVAVAGPGLTGVYIGLIVISWALYARITRAEMLVLRDQQFILAGRALGYSTPRILFRHALPNLLRPNLVFSMADIVLNILALAALSYLGVGVAPGSPELGAIIFDGQPYLLTAWWITTLPGFALVVLGAGFSLVGDALADRFGGRLELPG